MTFSFGPQEALQELISRGLIEQSDLVATPIIAEPARGNDRVIIVTRGDGSGYAVKRPRRDNESALQREAEYATWLRESQVPKGARDSKFSSAYPRITWIGPDSDALFISEVPRGATSIAELLGSDDAAQVAGHGTSIGVALASLHLSKGAETQEPLPHKAPLPLALSISPIRPELLISQSMASLEILRRVSSSAGLIESLANQAERWCEATPIHGDFHPRNIITFNQKLPPHEPGIMLIDLELGGLGPPEWDLSLFFASIVGAWYRGLRFRSQELTSEELDAVSHFPSKAANALLKAFLEAYLKTIGRLDDLSDASTHLPFLPAALVQIALEGAQANTKLDATADFCLSTAELAARDLSSVVRDLLEPNT